MATLRRLTLIVLFGGIATAGAAGPGAAQDRWYPSEWGPDDQRGAINRQTPAKVMEAARLITRGTIYQLGRTYSSRMPLFGTRHYSLLIPQTFGPVGDNKMTWHDEIISGELGQIGTQFDGLGHAGIDGVFYNGHRDADLAAPTGLTHLGVEHVGAFFTRGVLIDVAGYKETPALALGYEITAADLRGALAKQGTAITPGDAVFLHTGWGAYWEIDNDRFNAGCPGIGLDAGRMLVAQRVILVGADNWSVEVVPNPDPNLAFPVHQLCQTKNGIYFLENLDTAGLAADQVYEFAFTFAPVKFEGATGSPGNPVAIR